MIFLSTVLLLFLLDDGSMVNILWCIYMKRKRKTTVKICIFLMKVYTKLIMKSRCLVIFVAAYGKKNTNLL